MNKVNDYFLLVECDYNKFVDEVTKLLREGSLLYNTLKEVK